MGFFFLRLTTELLDDIVKLFKDEQDVLDDLPRFAVIGRPNAGKSSFINALIGENMRVINLIKILLSEVIFHFQYLHDKVDCY